MAKSRSPNIQATNAPKKSRADHPASSPASPPVFEIRVSPRTVGETWRRSLACPCLTLLRAPSAFWSSNVPLYIFSSRAQPPPPRFWEGACFGKSPLRPDHQNFGRDATQGYLFGGVPALRTKITICFGMSSLERSNRAPCVPEIFASLFQSLHKSLGKDVRRKKGLMALS